MPLGPDDPLIGNALLPIHGPLARMQQLQRMQGAAAGPAGGLLTPPPSPDPNGLFSPQFAQRSPGLLSSIERDARRDGILAAGLQLLASSSPSPNPRDTAWGPALARAGSAYLNARNQSMIAGSELAMKRAEQQRFEQLQENLANPAWRDQMGITERQAASVAGMDPEDAMKKLADFAFRSEQGRTQVQYGKLIDMATGNVIANLDQSGWTKDGSVFYKLDEQGRPLDQLDMTGVDLTKGNEVADQILNQTFSNQDTKFFQAVRKNHADARSAMRSDLENLASDRTLILSLARALEPNSVVREFEEAGARITARQELPWWMRELVQLVKADVALGVDGRARIMTEIDNITKNTWSAYQQILATAEDRMDMWELTPIQREAATPDILEPNWWNNGAGAFDERGADPYTGSSLYTPGYRRRRR